MTKQTSDKSFNLHGRRILGNFISETPTTEPSQEIAAQWIPIDNIKPGTVQPRQFFSEDSLKNLAETFQDKGFRGALNIRPLKAGTYELVAGERRWRAAKLAGLEKVRCIVDDYTDGEALEFALIENLQREDLSKLEETEGILQLMETKLGIARNDAITIIRTEGHSDKRTRSDVAPSEELRKIEALLELFHIELQTFRTKNLRTLALPEILKEAHLKKGLSYSSALELNKIKNDKIRQSLLEKVLKEQLSFREIKKQVKDLTSPIPEVGNSVENGGLIERLEATVKQAKKSKQIFQKSQKKKRLERLLRELEALLNEE